jgi:hypothetical protein
MDTTPLIATGSKKRLGRGQSYLMKTKELSELLAPVVDCSHYRLAFWDRAIFRRSEHDEVVRAGGEIKIVEILRWKPDSNWSIYLYGIPSTKRRVVREQFVQTVTPLLTAWLKRPDRYAFLVYLRLSTDDLRTESYPTDG